MSLNSSTSSVKGLNVRSGSWHLRRMIDGKLINKTIGRVDAMTLADAEKIAIDMINGKSLAKAKAPSQTLADVRDDLLTSPKGLTFKESYRALIKKQSEGQLKQFMSRQLVDIDRHEIRTWYNRGSNRPTATDGAFRTLHRLFEYAIALELITVNPCTIVNRTGRFKKNKRSGSISIDGTDLGRFVWALINYEPAQSKKNFTTARDVILLLLVSGIRSQEAMQMKWDNVNMKLKRFVIKDTKNRKDHTVPMTKLMLAMFKSRYENISSLNKSLKGNAALTYVFPNRNGTGPLTDIRKTLEGICKFCEIERLIPHDLRRTFATMVEELDVGILSQKRMLNHASGITGDYTQITMKRLLEQYEKVSNKIDLAMPMTINGREYDEGTGFPDNLLHLLYGDHDEVFFEPLPDSYMQ
jgi:integrase